MSDDQAQTATTETQSTGSDAEEVELEEEYEQATLYFQETTKREFQKWMNRMELDHNIVFDSEKRQRHEALIQVAMNHEDEFVEQLREIVR